MKKNAVVGYVRLSFDEDKENYDSILNQISIIKEFARKAFGLDDIEIFEDYNFSGYKFTRPGFTKMRRKAEDGEISVIIAKDLSRIGRHNAKTLLFLEEMEEIDVRVIAINDDIDTSNSGYDEILGVKTWVNEKAVKDASKKVRKVIEHKQMNGSWICAVPYGYEMTDYKTRTFKVDSEAAEIVKRIFEMYLEGLGFKKIANILSDENIPTPRMREKQLKENVGKSYEKQVKSVWSIATISGLLSNDFYTGTLRTGKYRRKNVNGKNSKVSEEKHYIFEDNHKAIIDKKTFCEVQEQMKKRSVSHYRGVRKYENSYQGIVFCGDCGSPMFSVSNSKRPSGFMCGLYHRRGLKGCTSHHIREEKITLLIKKYLKQVKDNSDIVLANIGKISSEGSTNEEAAVLNSLKREYEAAKESLKAIIIQKARESAKEENAPEIIDEIYKEIENEAKNKILGISNQILYIEERFSKTNKIKNTSISAAKIFDEILYKEKFTKKDLGFIVERITVYDDFVKIELKADIEAIFSFRNFDENNSLVLKTIGNNIINEGDPLEIFTDREGEIILKKYSPIGELGTFAKEYAESLAQSVGHITCIVDKDQVIAVSGAAKKDFLEKHLSLQMEKCINSRSTVIATRNDNNFVPLLENDIESAYNAELITPIIAEGDVLGAIVFLSNDKKMGEIEGKLAQTAAGFIGKQMEQ